MMAMMCVCLCDVMWFSHYAKCIYSSLQYGIRIVVIIKQTIYDLQYLLGIFLFVFLIQLKEMMMI